VKHTVSLKENHLFRRTYRGKSAAAPSLVLYARRNGRREDRLGLTVSTKVGKAVVRNKVRRRLREVYRLHEDAIPRGWDLVLVARVRSANTPFRQLEEQFLRLCGKLSLIKPREGPGQ